MQKTLFSNLFARRHAQNSDAQPEVRVAPIELDVADLEKVAGGIVTGPNGTWAANSISTSTVEGPNGTW